MYNRINDSIGITLVALVITVIVLLILAGVAISAIVGENGIFTKAKLAADKYNNAMLEEQQLIYNYTDILDTTDEIANSRVQFMYEPSGWTNSSVKVTVINNWADRGYFAEYSIDNGINWITYTTPIVIEENGTVLGRLTKAGLVGEVATANIINIDKTSPTVPIDIETSNVTSTGFTAVASGSVDLQSGGIEYEYKLDKIATTWQNNGIFTGLSAGVEYRVYARAKDIVNNVSEYKELVQKTGTVPQLEQILGSSDLIYPGTTINERSFFISISDAFR